MKKNQSLHFFPLGAIRAQGFLREQLLRSKDGMGGHLWELEPEMIADPYVKKSRVPCWEPENQAGWGAEISGNYWAGYIGTAFALNDPDMICRATEWVDAVLKTQKADGYLGTYRYEDSNVFEDFNAWGTTRGMRALIAFYEATGRKDVLTAVHRCMLWFCENWAGNRKTSYAGVNIVEPMILVYRLTKDERLLRFAEDYLEYLVDHDIFESSYTSMLKDEYHYNSNHTAGIGSQLYLPALVYSANGRKLLLEASEKELAKIRSKSVHVTGGPVSVTEYLGPVGATTESEYCNFSVFGEAYRHLFAITRKAEYGEYAEEMFYNAAQGARKKDEKAIAYLSAPNQIYATHVSSSAVEDYQVYAPCFYVSCCPVNAVLTLPEFVRGLMMHEDDTALYITSYGPCCLDHGAFAVREDTLYPFRNRVRFTIERAHTFSLCLRLPSWSEGYTVTLNGKQAETKERDGFVILHRDFEVGDTVEISFEASVRVLRVDDGDYAGKYPLAVRYGALVYSYHIPENWYPYTDPRTRPLPEGWSYYDVWPQYKEADVPDQHEQIGLRRYQISWNIALDEELSAADFTVEEREEFGYVWEDPPIRLHTHCYKAPDLCSPYPRQTFEPFLAYQRVTERIPLTLEPYGCTNLRITYFPKAKIGK